MVKYVLSYFNFRGRGELIRLMFALQKVEYTDDRIDPKDWPQRKGEFANGQVPRLTIDGKEMYQSQAINAYLARQFGYYGKCSMDAYEIERLHGDLEDTGKKYPSQEKDEEKMAAAMKTFFDEVMSKFFAKVEKILNERGDDEYYLGKFSLADLILLNAADYSEPKQKNILDKYPKIKALVERVRNIPEIKTWRANRPATDF